MVTAEKSYFNKTSFVILQFYIFDKIMIDISVNTEIVLHIIYIYKVCSKGIRLFSLSNSVQANHFRKAWAHTLNTHPFMGNHKSFALIGEALPFLQSVF